MNPDEIQIKVENYLRKKGLPVTINVAYKNVFLVQYQPSPIDRRSDITDFRSRLAGDIWLNIPFIVTNMTAVSGVKSCIAIAEMGGIGIVPQFFPIAERVAMIKEIKRAHSGIIENPWCVKPDETLKNAKRFMEQKKVSSLLVTENGQDNSKLLGILSHRDYVDVIDEDLKVETLMTRKLVTALPNITIEEARQLLRKYKIEKLPLVDDQGTLKGLIVAKELAKRAQFRMAVRDRKGRLMVAAAVGMNEKYLESVEQLVKAGADVIVADSPNAFTDRFGRIVREIKSAFLKTPLVAGSVDSPEGARFLINAGADAVKVGIGCGSACETRPNTGFGCPQLSALAKCVAVADGKPIICDGGIKTGSDVAKALGAGVDCIMSGSIFAGTAETPGRIKTKKNGEKVMVYMGSASEEAQFERFIKGELDFVRAPEGEEYEVPLKGSLKDVIERYLGWLRSSMAFAGARTLQEFRKIARFGLQTREGYEEGA